MVEEILHKGKRDIVRACRSLSCRPYRSHQRLHELRRRAGLRCKDFPSERIVAIPIEAPEGFRWAPVLTAEDQIQPPYITVIPIPADHTEWRPALPYGLSRQIVKLLEQIARQVDAAVHEAGMEHAYSLHGQTSLGDAYATGLGHLTNTMSTGFFQCSDVELTAIIFQIDMEAESTCRQYGPQIDAVVGPMVELRLPPEAMWKLTADHPVQLYAIPVRCGSLEDED